MANDSASSGRSLHYGLAFAGLVLAIILFIAVNVLSRAGLSGARIDLTADSLYTLSPGTHAVLSKIDEPVTLRNVPKISDVTILRETMADLGFEVRRVNGDTLRYHVELDGPELRQVFVGERGRRENTLHRRGPQRLELNVVVKSEQLPKPLTYRLTFERR